MRMEVNEANKVYVFKLVTIVASGDQFQWETTGDYKEHTSKLSRLRVRKLGYVFTSFLLSLVKDSFWKQ